MKKPRKQKKKHNADKVGTDFDWRTLVKGDLVKISQGSGPYYEGFNELGQPIHECMSDAGWYKVDSLDGTGIRAYNDYGFSHLWMLPEEKSASGLIRSPHKIMRVQKHE